MVHHGQHFQMLVEALLVIGLCGSGRREKWKPVATTYERLRLAVGAENRGMGLGHRAGEIAGSGLESGVRNPAEATRTRRRFRARCRKTENSSGRRLLMPAKPETICRISRHSY